MKKWIIVILIVLATLVVGLAVPIMMSSERGGTEIVDDTEASFSVQTTADKSNQTVTGVNYNTAAVSSGGTGEINATGAKGYVTPGNNKISPGNNPTLKTGTTGEYTPQPHETSPSVMPGSNSTDNQPPSPAPTDKEEVPENWVEAKIQKHRSEIEDADLADFRRIFPKVDQGYLQNFANDGYTDEEITQIKAYLRKTLGGDYERAKELFYKYSYLISED